MKKLFSFVIILLIAQFTFAQSTGDTIIVQSLHHGSSVRDTTVSFPNNSSLTFSKILMKYNMRCKDGKVSNGQNRNRGCGEWDYSCNTYIHDDSKIDSLYSRQISHTISAFSGDTFFYSTSPTFNYYLNYQSNVQIDSIISETQSTIGSGSINLSDALATSKSAGKSQYLFRASELSTAGVSTGNLDGIILNVSNSGGLTDYLRVKIKSTSDTALSEENPHLNGFTEVYHLNTTFSTGLNRLQFYTPYAWNGTDNIIVEFSFSNPLSGNAIELVGHSTALNQGMCTAGDKYFFLDGANYIQANSYKGIGGNNPRTIEAWIKTEAGGKEIVSWGRDAGGQKWNFRLEGSGELRVEVNGGYKIGTTDLRDGEWHHVACTFSGNNVTQVKLYVDGVLEGTKGQAAYAINTNITEGINLRISRGTNNRYFDGIIDEVRIWDTSLTAATLYAWRHKTIDGNHPNFSNLTAWYSMNEGSGSSILDSSLNSNNAAIIVGTQWRKLKGDALNKEFSANQTRPNTTFLQGNYNLSISTDTIVDTVENYQHSVRAYTVYKKSGLQSDSIANALSYYWPGNYEYIIDTNGSIIDSVYIGNNGNIVPTYLDYFRRYPMRFEIMSFVTPYGIGLDLGMEGKTWTFDVTDFAPVLKGDKRLTMEWGGQWQEEMDISFEFIVGTPPRDVLDIEQIWRVTKPSYNTIKANLDFRPRDVPMLSSGKSFKIRSAITGHGQEGEFIPRAHVININNNSQKETWDVWKECGANPVHPQGGTWIYDRAGWCPGMATDVKEIDITSTVSAGSTAQIDYDVVVANGATNYIVNNQLVTYGDPNFSIDATIVDIKNPTAAVEYAKTNYSCGSPTIVIRNTGSTTLTSLDIEYWINNASSKESYSWSGSLEFNEEAEVILPVGGKDIWKNMKASGNHFYAKVSNPNGSNDEYAYNNTMRSAFEIPAVMPGNVVIWMRTNNAANENKLYVYDSYGNEVFKRTSFANNTEYRDTLDLGIGCYKLLLTDSDGDGIDFWANNDGSGFLRLTNTNPPFGAVLQTLEPDFGKFIEFQFTTDHPLSVDEINRIKNDVFSVYPNPAETSFTVELNKMDEKIIRIYNSAGQQVQLNSDRQGDKVIFDSNHLTKGIYMIQVEHKGQIESKKIMIQ